MYAQRNLLFSTVILHKVPHDPGSANISRGEGIVVTPVSSTVDYLSPTEASSPDDAMELVDAVHGGGVLHGVQLALHLGGPV